MNKKILQLIMVLMIAMQGVMAQTVKIADVTQPPGQISVPVTMTGFTNVAAITLNIGFDSDVMSFVGIANTTLTGSWYSNYNNATKKLVIIYNATPWGTGYPINGPLLDIKFNYLGGFSSAITFGSGCDIANQYLQTIPNVTYENGSVTQTPATGFVSLATEVASPVSNVLVGLSMSGAGFSDVKSLSYKIAFDASKLTFTQVLNSVLGGSLTASANAGILTINWTGTPQNLSALTKVFDLKFVYNGFGSVPLVFKGGSQVSNSSLALIPVAYTNGVVNEDPGTTTLALADVTGALGSNVVVPLTLGPLGSGYLGSLSLNISYDNTVLDFTGVNPGTITTGVSASATAGVVHINWSKSTNTTDLTGVLMSLKFKYNGVGSAALTFAPGCVLTRTNLSNVTVVYTNGSVGQVGPYEGKVTIEDVTANAGDAVQVNLAFSTFTINAKTLNFNIQYDPARLTYTGYTSTGIPGLSANAAGGVVNVIWNGAAAVDLNVATLKLNFIYNGGGDGNLDFIGGTQIKDASLVILNTEYINGTVSTTLPTAVIVTQPINDTADLEGSMNFDIVATGATSYQWEYSPNGGLNWLPIPVPSAVTPNFSYGPVEQYFYNGIMIRCLLMPGSVYSDEVTLTVNPLTVNAKVYLQGAYMYCAPTMCTTLRDMDLVPNAQSYNTLPWNYAGTENLSPLPTDMVDWVLVELRSDINNLDSLTSRAGILLSDGSIVDVDGGLLKFPGYDMDNYYIVVTHRNHLPIMSATAQPLQSNSVLYDFTTSDSQSYFDAGIGGTPLADHGDGTWGMFAGDGNGDGFVDVIDLVDIYFVQVDTEGYLSGDWNLDQYVDVIDLVDVYFNNVDIMSHVPLY